ncbi:MAG: XRE family transcriptional regulator [Alphaproteobacteria bacterium CG_4_9_14_3_um_filter_47_13]|nr:MAG: XRE family transcriptional regulator [Alphaproteobacteria bacterium CG_4_9_14_3_um_filter_47_13]
MDHDLLHIQGKPYVLVPLHEYRMLTGAAQEKQAHLPQEILDAIYIRAEHPVKIIRRHRGMTQDDLAHASGLSRPFVTEIETGKKEGSVGTIRALAEALQVNTGLLV